MQYENLLSGSPLVPAEIYVLYGIAVALLFLFVTFNSKKVFLKNIIFSFFVFHGILICIFISLVFYLLIPLPKVIKASFNFSGNQKVEITFDKPLKRKLLNKSIYPETAGIWIFEDPIYDTHLYKKLVFYPYTKLSPGTFYTVTLSGIRNFLNRESNSYVYNFRTADVFDVLGETTTNSKFSVSGSFPQNGWDGINIDSTIRIRFSHPVDRTSAENNFSITPSVDGRFSWDGETMIFSPSTNLDFDREYSITEARGVKMLSGSLLTQEYTALFRTQVEVTKLTIPSYLQKYTLSCEIAALRMALAYRGIDLSEDELLGKIGFDPNGKKGDTWGNPYVGFVGNVKGKQMVNGYGVYWEPIARAANSYRYSKSFENWTIDKLTESIQKGTPVIAWISIKARTPTIWTTPTGDKIKAVADEHAVLAVGFTGSPNNPTNIIVNDPLIGEAYWTRESFEKKWNSLSNSGVLVY